MYVPALHLQNDWSLQVKVPPEENDGIKLFIAMKDLDDAVDIVRLLGTLEGP
jgi:hypothetical protein